jgi:hypothetical protein
MSTSERRRRMQREMRLNRDTVMGMTLQVRTRYIASIYAKRKKLTREEARDYINKQESRAMARSRSRKRT